jgi:hypothetical protein
MTSPSEAPAPMLPAFCLWPDASALPGTLREAPAGARRTRQARAGPAWKEFLTAQAHGVLAVGFVHAGTVLLRGLYALIVIEHGTRRVRLAGITANPDGAMDNTGGAR